MNNSEEESPRDRHPGVSGEYRVDDRRSLYGAGIMGGRPGVLFRRERGHGDRVQRDCGARIRSGLGAGLGSSGFSLLDGERRR